MNNQLKYRTMTQRRVNKETKEIKAVMAEDADFLRPLVRSVMQEFLEAEMAVAVGAEKSERVEGRLSYRSGYYARNLITRVGKLELRIPQDRNGGFPPRFSNAISAVRRRWWRRSPRCTSMGVSTRKVKTISEELCGHSFSASAISGFNKKLDEELGRFARREFDCEYPYLILDARYEKVRENAVIRSRAVLVAIGIDWEGRRQVLGVEMANRESSTSWKDFLLGLKRRGLRGVIFVGSDDHPGLKRAIMEVLPEAYWQRCYVHFLRNALDYLPRKGGDDCLVELRWLYDRRDAAEARRDLSAWLLRWEGQIPQTVRVGRRQYRGNFHLLQAAPGAPQPSQGYQHARTH